MIYYCVSKSAIPTPKIVQLRMKQQSLSHTSVCMHMEIRSHTFKIYNRSVCTWNFQKLFLPHLNLKNIHVHTLFADHRPGMRLTSNQNTLISNMHTEDRDTYSSLVSGSKMPGDSTRALWLRSNSLCAQHIISTCLYVSLKHMHNGLQN